MGNLTHIISCDSEGYAQSYTHTDDNTEGYGQSDGHTNYVIQKDMDSYYYRFIVRFPIGLDFLFITFLLHLFLSWTSSLSISSSTISASTLSNHVMLGLPTGLLPSTLNSIHFFTQSSSLFLVTCPYHLSLPLLMTVMLNSNHPSQFYTCPSVFHVDSISAL